MEWGKGIPYAAWVVTDLHDLVAATIYGVVAPHDVECDVDHGCSRFIFVDATFMEVNAYGALRKLGYELFDLERFARFPAADGIFRVLGLERDREPCDSRPRLCLAYRGELEIDELLDVEERAFGRDPLGMPDVLGMATGPIPRPTRDMGWEDDDR